MRASRGLLVVLVALLGACDRDPPTYDSFPIPIDLSTGVPLWRVRLPDSLVTCGVGLDGGPGSDAGVLGSMAIDLGEPLTVLQYCKDATRTYMNLEVVSAKNPLIKRARFEQLAVINLPATDIGLVGGLGHVQTVEGLVGKDLLASFSVRFVLDPANPFVQLFPETAGSNEDHAAACEAVVPYRFPISGFNEVIVNGTETVLPPSRIIVSACFEPNAFTGPADLQLDKDGRAIPSGIDLSLILTTGMEPIVIGKSALDRINAPRPMTDKLTLDRPGVLHVASGPVPLGLGSTGSIVLVENNDPGIGPCAELAIARQLEANGNCGTSTCTAAAYVELKRPLELAQAPDESALLQDVRAELRSASIREVDGFLGAEALRDVVLDVDYPHSRLVARCADGKDASCQQRPHFTSDTVATYLQCLPLSTLNRDGGVDAAPIDAGAADANSSDADLDASD